VNWLVWTVPIIGILAILFAVWLVRGVLSSDTGTPEMQDVAGRILTGARAYLNRQYRTIFSIAAVVAVVIAILVGATAQDHHAKRGILTFVAFLVGAAFSGISGFIAMNVAVLSNIRTAAGARRNLASALNAAFHGGAGGAFLIISLSLLGVTGMYALYAATGLTAGARDAPFYIIGYAFGASFVALFAQLGGGIYTKAADVGADLVGKVEANIPEDDPRNPAVIADLVGDNVGDCAGRGADLFESTAAEVIGAMILGVSLAVITNNNVWIVFPLVITAFGLLASIVGVLVVRPNENTQDAMALLNRGYYVVAALSVVFMFFVTYVMFHNTTRVENGRTIQIGDKWWYFAIAGVIGIAASILFVYITQYYTAGNWRPVRTIAEASRTGAATNIISGLSIGMETTGAPAVTIALAIGGAFFLGTKTGVTDSTLQNGIFGTACATVGILMSAAYVLSMDTFGPITDNAGGIVEMSNQPESVRDVTDALDSVGNTTKALTKGYAVGSAALAAFLLFSAYLDVVAAQRGFAPGSDGWNAAHRVDLAQPKVFIGGFLGLMLVFLFSSLAIRAVGKAAQDMISEVRRQWRERPGIMQGTELPDYARCVDISVRGALREMIAPGALAVLVPVIVGLLLRAEGAAGLLMVGTMGGVLMANVMNNGGGAWDNAKKFIEAGGLRDAEGHVLGKGSEAHAAAVVGDTVGDPFKDTAGPSLHVLVKLLATVTLVLAPLFR
jgi:K(+)-stimulated pyrophosphate-energized sodium pump